MSVFSWTSSLQRLGHFPLQSPQPSPQEGQTMRNKSLECEFRRSMCRAQTETSSSSVQTSTRPVQIDNYAKGSAGKSGALSLTKSFGRMPYRARFQPGTLFADSSSRQRTIYPDTPSSRINSPQAAFRGITALSPGCCHQGVSSDEH